MKYGMESLLLNVLFTILPLYIYQIFILNRNIDHRKHKKLVMVIVLSITIILCLSFPVNFFEGFTFDLRQVPFIIGSLYGGYIVGIPLFLVIVIYRFLNGGEGVYVNLYVVSLIVIFVPLMKAYYLLLKLKFKILLNTGISIICSLLIVFSTNLFIHMNFSIYSMNIVSLNYIFIQAAAIALLTYLIENLKESLILQQKIQEAERLHLVSQFAASVSHEVRNPLTVTKGFLQLLQGKNIPDEKKNNYLKLALSELKRAEEIITDYLSFAKPKIKSETIGNIAEDVKEVINILLPYAIMNQVQIASDFDNTLKDCMLKYDCQQFRQCLINIGKNGIEAMPNGGKLLFEIYYQNNQTVMIEISDTGIGMSSEHISKVGTAYFSTKETGTGLGMMVVKDIIKSMKGTLTIQSTLGKGTTFSISLPIYITGFDN